MVGGEPFLGVEGYGDPAVLGGVNGLCNASRLQPRLDRRMNLGVAQHYTSWALLNRSAKAAGGGGAGGGGGGGACASTIVCKKASSDRKPPSTRVPITVHRCLDRASFIAALRAASLVSSGRPMCCSISARREAVSSGG